MDPATDQHGPRVPPDAESYRFRGVAFDAARGVLLRPGGVEVALRPKAAGMLRHLARNPARVVPRDELMDAVWPDVAVTDDSITQCVAEIRRALGAEGAGLLRTLPRRGYLLDAEVRSGDGPPPAAAPPASRRAVARPERGRRRRAGLLAGAALLAGALAAAIVLRPSPPRPPSPAAAVAAAEANGAAAPARPLSVAVLPFADLGGDRDQDSLADAITDDLTSAVSARTAGSFVVGRGAALAYKGRPVDAKRIGPELGVRYVVQGSARRMGARVRANVQLLDAGTGAHLLTEGFDEPSGDAADVTRTLAWRIAARLDIELVRLESDRARAAGAQDATAVDLQLRGRALLGSPATREDLLEARRLFERSLALDDASADTHAFMGMTLTTLWLHGREAEKNDLLPRAEEHARRALEINPWHARGHYVRGQVAQSRQRFEEALAEFEITLGLAPNLPFVYARRGWVRNLTDDPAGALADFAQAARIGPREPYMGTTHWGMAVAQLMLGRDAEAVEHSVRAVVGNPDLPRVRANHVATLALAGRIEEARIALAELAKRDPAMTVGRFRRVARESSAHPLWLATHDRQAEALRSLGMPEE